MASAPSNPRKILNMDELRVPPTSTSRSILPHAPSAPQPTAPVRRTSWGHRAVAAPLVLAALAFAGCGGSDDDTAQAPTQAPTPGVETSTTSTQADSSTQTTETTDSTNATKDDSEDKPSAKTTAKETTRATAAPPARRETTLKTSLIEGTAGGKKDQNRFFVRTVKVDGGSVVVTTSGYPAANADRVGRGACNWIAGAESWMKSISVVGTGGAELATWSDGDKSCKAAR